MESVSYPLGFGRSFNLPIKLLLQARGKLDKRNGKKWEHFSSHNCIKNVSVLVKQKVAIRVLTWTRMENSLENTCTYEETEGCHLLKWSAREKPTTGVLFTSSEIIFIHVDMP